MRTINYVIDPRYDGKKLLYFLKSEAGLSSRLIRSLKQQPDGLMLNSRHIRTVDIVKAGDVLTVNLPPDRVSSEPSGIMPQVIYEDEDILVVDKPATLAVHESHNHQGDTLANSVASYLAKQGRQCRFRAVGRLDKGTSGLMVCALNSHAAARLSGRVEKKYVAIVCGELAGSGTIDAPIYRPDPILTARTVDPRGVRAVTHYSAEKTNGSLTVLSISLETGRTHQIRVHFSHIGAPLLGDTLYGEGSDLISHHALHCAEVELCHPVSGRPLTLTAPMPDDMAAVYDGI